MNSIFVFTVEGKAVLKIVQKELCKNGKFEGGLPTTFAACARCGLQVNRNPKQTCPNQIIDPVCNGLSHASTFF